MNGTVGGKNQIFFVTAVTNPQGVPYLGVDGRLARMIMIIP